MLGTDYQAGFASHDLGEPRCAKRLPKLAASLAQAQTESIPAASGGWSEVIADCQPITSAPLNS